MQHTQGHTLCIRDENASDYDAITEVTIAAFKTLPISQNNEQFIIQALRAASALTLSLVAELNGEVVGHIASSAVTFQGGNTGWEGLGPLSVHPDLHRRGIGSALMRECLSRLKQAGAKGCVLIGDPAYYVRFGFESWPGLTHEGVPNENVMALAFGAERADSRVCFHPAFGEEA